MPNPTPTSSDSQHLILRLNGHCHCHNLTYALNTGRDWQSIISRRCGCEFCQQHRPRWWSDPQGRFEFWVADPAALVRYRFGHKTADFLLCARCGGLAAAITVFANGPRAVTNLNLALIGQLERIPPERLLEALAEDSAQRMQRRGANWTPLSTPWPIAGVP